MSGSKNCRASDLLITALLAGSDSGPACSASEHWQFVRKCTADVRKRPVNVSAQSCSGRCVSAHCARHPQRGGSGQGQWINFDDARFRAPEKLDVRLNCGCVRVVTPEIVCRVEHVGILLSDVVQLGCCAKLINRESELIVIDAGTDTG